MMLKQQMQQQMTFDLKQKYSEFIEEQSEEPVDNQNYNSKVLIIDGLNTFIRAFSVLKSP